MKDTLEDIILQEIRERGPMPFPRYMELCLYHPELGYYQKEGPVTGRSGDFFTAPHVHALFGQTIGGWIDRTAGEMNTDALTVTELGPGDGQLAQDILDNRPAGSPPRLSLVLVEESRPRRKVLEERFQGRPVTVISPEDFRLLPPFEGVVLANEFFDALPLRVFVKQDQGILEAHVAAQNGHLVEVLLPPSVEPGRDLRRLMEGLPSGYRVEVSPQWGTWLEAIAGVLARGRCLIIDYGEFTDGLVVPWRMGGTLRCFSRHQVDTDPYADPGHKDITAHVNFSLLQDRAREVGLAPASYSSQGSFLIRAGILEKLTERMEALPERDATNLWLTVKNLIHEEAMGEIFKALVLEKGLTSNV